MSMYKIVRFQRDVTIEEVKQFLSKSNYALLSYTDFEMCSEPVKEVIYRDTEHSSSYIVYEETELKPLEHPGLTHGNLEYFKMKKAYNVKHYWPTLVAEVRLCVGNCLWPAKTSFIAYRLDRKRSERIQNDAHFFGERDLPKDYSGPYRCFLQPEDLKRVTRKPAYRNHDRESDNIGFSRWNGNACRFYESGFTSRMEYARGEGLFNDIDFEI